jgi:two-component system NarL family response regulator
MQGDRVIGVFGQMSDIEEDLDDPLPPHLTPRQTEVLRLLKRGRSTEQIAQELQLSTETVRNHVRHLLRALGVHTRLEAVAVARP